MWFVALLLSVAFTQEVYERWKKVVTPSEAEKKAEERKTAEDKAAEKPSIRFLSPDDREVVANNKTLSYPELLLLREEK